MNIFAQPVLDGKIDFATFVWRCARGLRGAHSMRPTFDDPLPLTVTPDRYYDDSLLDAQKELGAFESLTPDQIRQHHADAYQSSLALHDSHNRKYAVERKRLETMLGDVECWTPPTAEHEGLKDFMVKQLEEAIDWTHDSAWSFEESVEKWEVDRLDYLRDRVMRFATALKRQRERAKERSRWLQDLHASVPQPGSAKPQPEPDG